MAQSKQVQLARDAAMRVAGYQSPKEIAALLHVHVFTVYRWINQGNVNVRKESTSVYVQMSSLQNVIGVETARAMGLPHAEYVFVKEKQP